VDDCPHGSFPPIFLRSVTVPNLVAYFVIIFFFVVVIIISSTSSIILCSHVIKA